MDEVRILVRVRPAAPGCPWRASVENERGESGLEFESPEALARYLAQIEPTRPQGLR